MANALTNDTLKALRRILRAADLGTRKLSGATGLTPSQLLTLREVEQRGETTPSVLSGALQFGQATITNIIDRLEDLGMVTRERSNRDKRQFILRVTERGRRTIVEAPDLLQTRFKDAYEALPMWERAMILAALERVGEIIGAELIDAASLPSAGEIVDLPEGGNIS